MGRRRGKGRASRRSRAASKATPDEESGKPHTMVFSRAGVGTFVKQLATDLRLAFEPYTAMRLRFTRSNVLKDAVALAGQFSVTHLLYFTHPEDSVNLRIVTCPHGPTLTFRVAAYSLRSDVLSAAKKFNSSSSQFHHAPLLIMNGFSGDGNHLRLLTATFRSLLPALNLQRLNLRTVRRCVLLNYCGDTDRIELRHYSVRLAPKGVTKAVRKLRRKRLPDLSRYADMADFVGRAGYASDSGLSDADFDGEHNTIDSLPVSVSGVHAEGSATAVRLTELGPRLTLQLIKVEESVNSGSVLYHKFVTKSAEEQQQLEQLARRRRRLRERRRVDQQRRVEARDGEKREHRRRCLQGMVAAGNISQQEAKRLLKAADGDGEGEGNGEASKAEAGGAPAKRRRLSTASDGATAKAKPKTPLKARAKAPLKARAKAPLKARPKAKGKTLKVKATAKKRRGGR